MWHCLRDNKLAILTQYRRVMDTHSDRCTRMADTALAWHRIAKMFIFVI